jgi:phosphate transport system protein
MQRHLDEELAALKHKLLKMSALAEAMIVDAVAVLVDKNEAALPHVARSEEEVNGLQVEIDENCLTLIALHQPAAFDLRFILGAAKTNAELERLADQAVNICDKAKKLLHEPPIKPFVIIPKMAAVALSMLKDSLHAYVNLDANQARTVLLRDDQVDEMKAQVTENMLAIMDTQRAAIKQAVSLILIARNLERIGDHATNIAENAIFVLEGRDIRHHHMEEKK